MPDVMAALRRNEETAAKRFALSRSLPRSLPNDGEIMRGLFYAMIAVIALALIYDYDALRKRQQFSPVEPGMANPVLPAYSPPRPSPGLSPGSSPQTQSAPARERPPVTADPAMLREAMKIELASGGILQVSGTIDPGSAERFAAEIARVGEYVKRIELNSPGGSVRDALAISRTIRERELDTAVADGALCASSCPLILAGGKARHAGSAAAIGVHQVFIPQGELRNADNEVSGTQTLTAEITRHLETMGVDPALWLHALETPPSQLYYFTPEELQTYRLATAVDEEPAA